MYLPKSKFIIRPAELDEFADGYVGPVLETSAGEFFAGSSLDTVSTRLTPLFETELPQIERPFHQYVEPTDADYRSGFYTRYFLQTNRTKKIVEVSVTQFKEKRTAEGISAVSLIWQLVGSRSKIKTQNEKTVKDLTKDFPALPSILKDPLEFVL
jgi:hypothetical protein